MKKIICFSIFFLILPLSIFSIEKIDIRFQGELPTGGYPYIGIDFGGERWTGGINLSAAEKEVEYEYPSPYNFSKIKIFMVGGRVSYYCPKYNLPEWMLPYNPYISAEINPHVVNTTWVKNKIIWEVGIYMGGGFRVSPFLTLFGEVGLQHFAQKEEKGISFISYNVGIKLPLKGGEER